MYVVARYNEDVSWTKDLQNVVLYDKSEEPVPGSVPLKNIGREADTYLRYIIEHYHDLPEFVVFLQGNPFDHMSSGSKIEDRIFKPTVTKPFLTEMWTEHTDRYKEVYFREYYQLLFDQDYSAPFIQYSCGAQWAVPRECITHRPIQFYKRLLTMLHWNEDFSGGCFYRKVTDDYVPGCRFDPFIINAWTLERLWGHIFDPSVPTSNIFV